MSRPIEPPRRDQTIGVATMRLVVDQIAERIPQRADQRRKAQMTPALRAELQAIADRRGTRERNPVADARLNPEELEAARARLDEEGQP